MGGWMASVVALQGGWMSSWTVLDGWLLLYVGPDQLLPLTSFLGAIAGILMMFWTKVLGGVRRVKRLLTDRKSATDEA